MDTATAAPVIETAPAAPTAAPSVEKAEKAPKEEKGAFGREVIIKNYEYPAAPLPPVDDETVADEPVNEEVAAVEEDKAPEPPKETRLAEYRKADGRFDEDKLEPVLNTAKQIQAGWNDFNALISRHPALEADILRAMKADGRTLDAEAEARLARAAAPVEKPAPVSAKTEGPADVKALGLELAKKHKDEFERQRVAYGEAAANYYWMMNVQTPYYEALAEAKDAARNAATQATAAQAEAQRRTEYGTQKVREQLAECAKQYPTLYKLDPALPYGGDFADKEIGAEVSKLRAAMDGPMSLLELTEIALFRLKRVKPQVAAPAKKTGLPPVIAQRAPAPRAAVADKGTFGRTVIVKNG